MKILWGDIHNHCGITYGVGSIENAMNAARSQLDFCSITPHALWPDMPPRCDDTAYIIDFHNNGFEKIRNNWNKYIASMQKANNPGNFTTLFSYEMHSSQWGDHTMVSPDSDVYITNKTSPLQAVQESRARLIGIPHHIGYTPGYRGINWAGFNNMVSPVVEVCSKHGCAMNEGLGHSYYHDMGPLDPRNTVYSGLAKGNRFGFIGSTDHHAGYPGSYGDGKIAVLAGSNTREDIWHAINARRTYAVTGNKILCDFKVNGTVFGGETPRQKAEISYSVEAGGAIDRIVIYKDLKPFKIIDGLTLPHSGRRYKAYIELGWGGNDTPYTWQVSVKSKSAKFLGAEPCFRGRNFLSPTQKIEFYDDINKTQDSIQTIDENTLSFTCQTVKNHSPHHPLTSGVVLEFEGNPEAELIFDINGKTFSTKIKSLLEYGITGHMKEYSSNAYKIHTPVQQGQYMFSGNITDNEPGNLYHMEVRQTNGDEAFVSPVYMV